MSLNFGTVPNSLFQNTREEELGIGEKEKERGASVSKTEASDQFTVTSSYTEVTGMNITHESKTGRVIIMFSSTLAPFSDDDTGGSTIGIKLQKDGVDVSATLRACGAVADDGGTDVHVVNMCSTIIHLDTNVEKNTWRIMAKYFGLGDNYIDDRELIILDI